MRVADKRYVVAARKGAVDRGANAGVGLRTGNDQVANACRGEDLLQVRTLKRVTKGLMHERLTLEPLQFGNVLPGRASLRKLSIGVLHPHHRDLRGPRAVNERGDVRDHRVAAVRACNHANLHVDH